MYLVSLACLRGASQSNPECQLFLAPRMCNPYLCPAAPPTSLWTYLGSVVDTGQVSGIPMSTWKGSAGIPNTHGSRICVLQVRCCSPDWVVRNRLSASGLYSLKALPPGIWGLAVEFLKRAMAPLHSPRTHSIPSLHTHTHSESTIKLCIDRSFCPLTHIPADMGGGTYGYPDLYFSKESVSAVDVHSSVPGVLQNAHPRSRTKAYDPDFPRRGQPTLNQGTNEGAETPRPEYIITGIRDGDVSAVHFLDSRLRTMFYPSTLGSGGFMPAPVIVNRDITHADSDLTRTDATRNAFREGTLTNIPPIREAAAAPSPSSLQPPSIGGPPNSPYSCNDCGKTFAQSQGVSRHHRETHGASLCMICCSFEWGRPYRLKEHLKKRHPDVDPDKALAQATKAQRRATMTTRRRLQKRVSPRTHHDGATDKDHTYAAPARSNGTSYGLPVSPVHGNRVPKVGTWTDAGLPADGWAAPWWRCEPSFLEAL